MSYELLAAPPTDTTAQETKSVAAAPVEKLLAEIGRDSRREPQQYLDESVTPHGGE